MYGLKEANPYFLSIGTGLQVVLMIIAWNTEGVRMMALPYYVTFLIVSLVDLIIWMAEGYFSI